MAVSLGGSEV